MKISAITPSIYFNGQNTDYKKEIEEKSHTTLKLAIGTAIAGAGMLGAYYLTKGGKTPNTNNKNTEIIAETSKDILEKLPENIKNTLNNIKIKSQNFKERIISILGNGKTKVEYIGKENNKILKKRIYITQDGEIQGSITNFSNGKTVLEKFNHTDTTDILKKIFLDKKGKTYKTQISTTELQTSAKIPVGFRNIIEITEQGKSPLIRTTDFYPDMKPKRTNSNGTEIIYGYTASKANEIIGHAFSENKNKFTLKFINNPKFKKEFNSVEEIYAWSNGNFKQR